MNVYDFDKTLYKKDSSIEFFLFCLKKKPKIALLIPGICILLILNKVKVIKKEILKEYFFSFLKEFDNISKLVDEFWKRERKNINKDIIKDSAKEKRVVISASPTFLLKKICKEIGVSKLIASEVDERTGKFISKNCYGSEKVNRLKAELKNKKINEFYSDSHSDEPLAKLAKKAYYVCNGEISDWNFNRLYRIFQKCINLGFMIISSFILFCCFFLSYRKYACKITFKYNNFIYLAIGIILLLVLYFISKLINKSKLFQNKSTIIISIISIIMIFLLYYISKQYWFLTGWDAGNVRRTAELIAINKLTEIPNDYFSCFQNNMLITIFFSYIIKLSNFLNVYDYNSALLFFNCTLYSATGFLLFQSLKMITKNGTISLFGFLVYYLLIGFSPWIVVPYSDSLALFFVSLILYLYLIMEVEKKSSLPIYLLLLMLTIVGYNIKPQIVLIVIPIIIYKLLNIKLHNLNKTRIFLYIMLSLVVSIFTVLSINGLKDRYFNIDKEKGFGLTNYLMWGHNYETRGVYPINDVKYSKSFNTKRERANANLNKVIERINYLKITGLIELYVDKTLTNYNDGTFAWSREGSFYSNMKYKGNKAFTSYYYYDGSNNWIFRTICQSLWITILCICFLVSLKKCNDNITIVKTALICLFIFELLFEARARYIFAYAPMYILMMTYFINTKIQNKRGE